MEGGDMQREAGAMSLQKAFLHFQLQGLMW